MNKTIYQSDVIFSGQHLGVLTEKAHKYPLGTIIEFQCGTRIERVRGRGKWSPVGATDGQPDNQISEGVSE